MSNTVAISEDVALEVQDDPPEECICWVECEQCRFSGWNLDSGAGKFVDCGCELGVRFQANPNCIACNPIPEPDECFELGAQGG